MTAPVPRPKTRPHVSATSLALVLPLACSTADPATPPGPSRPGGTGGTGGTTGATPAVALDAWGGERHVILLKSDGSVWTWGSNAYGILGQGPITTPGGSYTPGNLDSDVPVRVLGPGGVGFLGSVKAVMSGE